MNKKITAIVIGIAMALQNAAFTAISADETEKDLPIVQVTDIISGKTDLELTQGETVQLDFGEDRLVFLDYNDIFAYSSGSNVLVTHDGRLTGSYPGESTVRLYIRDTYLGGYPEAYYFNVNVKPGDNLSEDRKAGLQRLAEFPYIDYQRPKAELLGILGDTPRLDMTAALEIIDNADSLEDIFSGFNEYCEFPDAVSVGHNTDSYTYWFDGKGNKSVSYNKDLRIVTYTEIADDGTVIGSQMLYPNRGTFIPNGHDKDYDHIDYNSLPLEGTGALELTFKDWNEGGTFADMTGTFKLMTKPDDGSEPRIAESWKAPEEGTIRITGLARDIDYELVYEDEFHPDNDGEMIKYDIIKNVQTHIYSFHYTTEYKLDVFMKKVYLYDPREYNGDVNRDGLFGIADVVTFQRWLLGDEKTVLGSTEAADLCIDGVLDVYDLIVMKRRLVTGEPKFVSGISIPPQVFYVVDIDRDREPDESGVIRRSYEVFSSPLDDIPEVMVTEQKGVTLVTEPRYISYGAGKGIVVLEYTLDEDSDQILEFELSSESGASAVRLTS